MSIFFYGNLKIDDIVTLSVGDNQIRYIISNIDIAEYRGNKFIHGKAEYRENKFIHGKKEEIGRGNLFSILFENRADMILQVDVPFQDKPKFNKKMFIELKRLD